MKEVDVYDRADELIGSIRYDEDKGQFEISPPDHTTLAWILTEPIYLAGGKELNAEDDPEQFMEELHRQYNGQSLRVTECQDEEA